jgi:anti-sigma B factor antagonist
VVVMAMEDWMLRIVEMGPSRLAVIGELDLAGVPELEAQLAACVGDVALDCSGLTFVDASGLGLLVRTRNACDTRGVKFTLVEPSGCLLRLLSITGLDAVFLTTLDGSGL